MTQITRQTNGLRYLTLAIVALLVVAPATAAAVPSPPHEVFGTVTDQDGDPVEGASVTVTDADGNSHAATTNADGYYEIKFPADEGDAGETLTVEVSGESETTSFASGSSERLDVEVTISSDDGRDENGDDDDDRYSSGGSSSGDSSSAGDSSDTAGESGDGTETPVDSVTTTEEPSSPEPTTSESTTEQSTTERQTTEQPVTEERTTSTGIPGFGLVVAVLALVAVAFVAARRE
ncbi:carboxypeptidase regulatory-like domain-containing protein [Halogeometricum luteum]|uniref:Carboxypeptidase regulatory-like domain-containing protein n=1 Tax=Halogeometricum luteum TaxID=2950537 RepID=A0ABU2FZY2_9EURY|nr:carboxypeptidase regulatory-like domain-containing protein [Halogeometricum sp. S3BR5-2]MDS0294100.1 carboxypeptidase regulatory-like domain-containing protein [Halogeometricum sp. S3BR5-2]